MRFFYIIHIFCKYLHIPNKMCTFVDVYKQKHYFNKSINFLITSLYEENLYFFHGYGRNASNVCRYT